MGFSQNVKEEIKTKYFRTGRKPQHKDSDQVDKDYLMIRFLMNGTVSDPEREYHLEFSADLPSEAERILNVLERYGLNPRLTERNGKYVVYLKGSNDIADALNLLGAHNSLMEFENMKILKEYREAVQRQVNAETANSQKTATASVELADDIELIRSKIGLNSLPENLREAAQLRLEYPEASLNELTQYFSETISRSGVNHRLRKIRQIAEDLRSSEN